MKLSKDKSTRNIPPAAFSYRLGNRSALDWVIDRYRVSTDKRSGITNDPNREADPKYILRLIAQVITVSLETQDIIAALPSLNLENSATNPVPSADTSLPADPPDQTVSQSVSPADIQRP